MAAHFYTPRQHLARIARLQQRMQSAIMLRCQPHRYTPTPGCEVTPSDWQQLLAEFDASVQALRVAYQALRAAEPAVRQLAADWRTRHQCPAIPDLLTVDDPQAWATLLPEVEQTRGDADELISRAMTQWATVSSKYLRLLTAQTTT